MSKRRRESRARLAAAVATRARDWASLPHEAEGQGKPSYEANRRLPMRELPRSAINLADLGMPPETPVRAFVMGECSVLYTINNGKTHHLSIAHISRYPTWDEITEARYRIVPDHVSMALVLPPKGEYINHHRNCFQLVEVRKDGGHLVTAGPD